MAYNLQILRSPSSGRTPPAGTYQPGTPYINFADLDFGIIDASQNPQTIVPITVFTTTAQYSVGDLVVDLDSTSPGFSQIWRANKAIASGSPFNPNDWEALGAGNAGGTIPGADAGASVTVDVVAPTTPKTGDLWYDSNTQGRLFVFDGIQWVDAAPASVSPTVTLPAILEFADDAAAAAGGVAIDAMYHTAGIVKVRVV